MKGFPLGLALKHGKRQLGNGLLWVFHLWHSHESEMISAIKAVNLYYNGNQKFTEVLCQDEIISNVKDNFSTATRCITLGHSNQVKFSNSQHWYIISGKIFCSPTSPDLTNIRTRAGNFCETLKTNLMRLSPLGRILVANSWYCAVNRTCVAHADKTLSTKLDKPVCQSRDLYILLTDCRGASATVCSVWYCTNKNAFPVWCLLLCTRNSSYLGAWGNTFCLHLVMHGLSVENHPLAIECFQE